MKKIVLDTNAYSQFMVGNKHLLDLMSSSDVIYLSIFVLAELQYGFKHGKKREENSKQLQIFCQKSIVQVINTSTETADIYAEIKLQLKKHGTPIPNNDLWIAAHTIEMGAVLITSDKHFDYIDGLRKQGYEVLG